MRTEYAEFLPTTKLKRRRKLSPKTKEPLRRQAEP
jgi:hypothetical protein